MHPVAIVQRQLARLVAVDDRRYGWCTQFNGDGVCFHRDDFTDVADFQADLQIQCLTNVHLDLAFDMFLEAGGLDADVIDLRVEISRGELTIVIRRHRAHDMLGRRIGNVHRRSFHGSARRVFDGPDDAAASLLRPRDAATGKQQCDNC